jgi:hypothetical protein
MRRRLIMWRGLLVVATVVLCCIAVTGVASAHDGHDHIPTGSELRDRSSQRDTGSILNRYEYANANPIDRHDPSGH